MIGFPLLLIPLAIVNIIVFLMPGVPFTATLVSLTLPSLAVWQVTLGDAILIIAVLLLLLEIIKASRPGTRSLVDHLLSLLALVGAAAEFLWLPAMANAPFFLLVVLICMEFVAGLVFALRRVHPRASRASVPAGGASGSEPAPAVPGPDSPTPVFKE